VDGGEEESDSRGRVLEPAASNPTQLPEPVLMTCKPVLQQKEKNSQWLREK